MCSQNRPRFKVQSERLSNEVQVPCLRGLRNDQQKSCFLLSPNVPLGLAPTWLLRPPRHLSEGYDSCTRGCCWGSNWVPSDYQSDALTTRPSVPLGTTKDSILKWSKLYIYIYIYIFQFSQHWDSSHIPRFDMTQAISCFLRFLIWAERFWGKMSSDLHSGSRPLFIAFRILPVNILILFFGQLLN